MRIDRVVHWLVSIGSLATLGLVVLVILALGFWQAWGFFGRVVLVVLGLLDVFVIGATIVVLARYKRSQGPSDD